jgi:hypothetical protein
VNAIAMAAARLTMMLRTVGRVAQCYAGDDDLQAMMVSAGWAWSFGRYPAAPDRRPAYVALASRPAAARPAPAAPLIDRRGLALDGLYRSNAASLLKAHLALTDGD